MTTAKGPDAFRTISEVSDELDVPQHVLRFWETKFTQVKPLKRGGGRRYYRPGDIDVLKGIRSLLYSEGFTIRGVQKVFRDKGIRYVAEFGRAPPEPHRTRAPRPQADEVVRVLPAAPAESLRVEPVQLVLVPSEETAPRPTDGLSLEAAPIAASVPAETPPIDGSVLKDRIAELRRLKAEAAALLGARDRRLGRKREVAPAPVQKGAVA